MQTFKWGVLIVVLLGAALAEMKPSVAQETVKFTTPVEAYRQGVSAYKAGKIDLALSAFRYSSERGVLGAMLRLARMYALGDSVEKDHATAFVQYQRIVLNFSDLAQDHAGAKYVAEAYVALGGYYELGIPPLGMKANKTEAAGHYRYAASYFRNPVAQFRLGRLYLKGEGVEQNISIAAKWLHSAAKKGHAPSQAVLAQLLWQGGPVKKRSVQALALLDLALKSARKTERKWIKKLHKKIFSQAQPDDIKKAAIMMAEWRTRYGTSLKKTKSEEADSKSVNYTVDKPQIKSAKEVKAVKAPSEEQLTNNLAKNTQSADQGAVLGSVETSVPRAGFTNVGADAPE